MRAYVRTCVRVCGSEGRGRPLNLRALTGAHQSSFPCTRTQHNLRGLSVVVQAGIGVGVRSAINQSVSQPVSQSVERADEQLSHKQNKI